VQARCARRQDIRLLAKRWYASARSYTIRCEMSNGTRVALPVLVSALRP
jgi:hypothetical protein